MNLNIHIVLVGTLYSRNLGSCSRVMANMGGGRLITIDEKCEYNLEARQGAAGAQTHLVERYKYASWADFFAQEPEGIRIAFCARDKFEKDNLALEDRLHEIFKHFQSKNEVSEMPPIYFVFGPEDHGLTNHDVEYANYICELPIYGPFKSLNLSHALLLALYIAQRLQYGGKLYSTPTEKQKTDGDTNRFHFPDKAIQDWLTELGFEIGDRRRDVYKTVKRLLLHNMATAKELRILEAIVQQTSRKLKELKELKSKKNDVFS